MGKATENLLEMLEGAECRREALLAGQEGAKREDTQARLEQRVLADLPSRVQACLEDLETLLRVQQVERDRALLGSLIS